LCIAVKKMHFKLASMRSRIHKTAGLARTLEALAVLCFLLGTAGWVDAASTGRQKPQGYAVQFNANFAVADFDGDRKPDLAIVEAHRGSSSNTTRYSIRLQLAVGPAQVFGVIAPAGGLQIVARDVNGDNALDVLVSTAWMHNEVAVLLNDGHGNFKLADPAAFPLARWEGVGNWNSRRLPRCESTVLVRIEHRAGELQRESKFDKPIADLRRGRPADFARINKPFVFAPRGRAPPTFVLPS
jgi:hypothetical protein